MGGVQRGGGPGNDRSAWRRRARLPALRADASLLLARMDADLPLACVSSGGARQRGAACGDGSQVCSPHWARCKHCTPCPVQTLLVFFPRLWRLTLRLSRAWKLERRRSVTVRRRLGHYSIARGVRTNWATPVPWSPISTGMCHLTLGEGRVSQQALVRCGAWRGTLPPVTPGTWPGPTLSPDDERLSEGRQHAARGEFRRFAASSPSGSPADHLGCPTPGWHDTPIGYGNKTPHLLHCAAAPPEGQIDLGIVSRRVVLVSKQRRGQAQTARPEARGRSRASRAAYQDEGRQGH